VVVLGIDTGSQGAYVALSDRAKIIHKFVFSHNDEGIDFKAYIDDLKSLKETATIAYVESVHAIYGASAGSTFTFGRNFQLALDGLMAVGIPFKLVPAKEWQKAYFVGAEKVFKKGSETKIDTKAMALKSAQKLFKGEDFIAKRSVHDGLVDATLIARYGLMKEKTKS